MNFFHVSHDVDSFTVGQDIELACQPDILQQSQYFSHVAKSFAGGLSRWGHRCVTFSGQATGSIQWEILLENCRVSQNSYRPSRLQSIFAWKTIWDALDYATEYASEQLEPGTVEYRYLWEIKSEGEPHFGDMLLFQNANYIDVATARAHTYWQGDMTALPQVEVLLPLPVRVVARAGRLRCYKDTKNKHGATLELTY